MRKISTFFTVLLILSLVFSFAGEVRQAKMEKTSGQFDPAAYVQTQQLKFNWLVSQAVPLSTKSIITINVTKDEIDSINNYKCESCGSEAKFNKNRVGVVKDVSFEMLNASSRPAKDGMVWTAAARSDTASALRVHFTDFNLPVGASVYIYNMDGEAFGPYTGRGPGDEGDFWSHTLTGPIAYVQLHTAPGIDKNDANFKVAGVGHLGEKFLLPFYQHKEPVEGIDRTKAHCSYNENCVEDASCYNVSALSDAKYAVAHMQWISGAYIWICTGGLIADMDTTTETPYFLTANHCLSRNKDAGGLECYFQYWTANCGGSCYDPVGAVPRTLGSSVVDSSRDGDHTLLLLDENPPAGSVYLGWTNAPVATSDGTNLYRLSHPSGAPQAYSKHAVETTLVECSGLPIGEFIYSEDLIGATEGGSSGSPVVNGSGQIVGQLYGACGYTLEVCDPEQNRTVDGAFAFYYSQVAPYLDNGSGPGGSEMHVASIVLSTKSKGPKTDAIVKVTIVDENGAPVEGATVSGTFSGDVSGSGNGTTGADGEATIKVTITGSISSFTFCVDNVTLSGFTYDSAANVETCDTL